MFATYEEQMMTEALAEHDKGCCTEDAPCTLRVGVTATLANHKMTPDFIIREESKQQGRAWNGGKVSPTEAQTRFWASLMTQLDGLGQNDLADALAAEWNGIKNFRDYSVKLDATKATVQSIKQAQPKKVQTEEGLSDGMYLADGTVYKVKRSGAGHLYAMVLTEEGFQFERGAIRVLKFEHRMTLEQAKAYGQQTGTCCVCGRELTNETSINEGIGPVCGGRI